MSAIQKPYQIECAPCSQSFPVRPNEAIPPLLRWAENHHQNPTHFSETWVELLKIREGAIPYGDIPSWTKLTEQPNHTPLVVNAIPYPHLSFQYPSMLLWSWILNDFDFKWITMPDQCRQGIGHKSQDTSCQCCHRRFVSRIGIKDVTERILCYGWDLIEYWHGWCGKERLSK